MSIITITATGIGPQLISGIPQLVSLSTNVPSTIFYTLDGSVPNLFSEVYLSPILMPTEVSTRLRALAVSGSDHGSLDITFSTDSTDLTYPRRVDGYGLGIAVDAYDVADVLLDGYKPDENLIVDVPARFSDYELRDLDIKYSRTGPDGEGPGTIILNGPVIGGRSAIDPRASSPNNQNVYFNPRSMYIVMDGTKGFEDQSVYLLNKPYMCTMDVRRYLGGKLLRNPHPYVSGSHIKTFYSRQDGYGLAVAYYYDSNESRWVVSRQRYDLDSVVGTSSKQTGGPLVFKWIYNKRSVI